MDFKKIILCRGIQGSNKSFYAKNWVSKDPERRVRFSNNDIRNMLGNYLIPSREHIIKSLLKTFIYESLQYGYDIIIDNMNLNSKEVEFIKDIVENWNNPKNNIIPADLRHKYKIEFKDFFTPLPICIERDSKRKNPIGKEIITETYNKYKDLIEDGMFNNIQTN